MVNNNLRTGVTYIATTGKSPIKTVMTVIINTITNTE